MGLPGKLYAKSLATSFVIILLLRFGLSLT
nr:MAG TPA: hypothetical protein [Caudoviricetes sp.]